MRRAGFALAVSAVVLAGCTHVVAQTEISDEAATYNDPNARIVCPAGSEKRVSEVFYRELDPRWTPKDVYPPPPGYVPPQLLQIQPLRYPTGALGGLKRAFVSVASDIDKTGAVASVRVVCSSDPGFESAATDAARTARYRPAATDGVPEATIGIQPFVFSPR